MDSGNRAIAVDRRMPDDIQETLTSIFAMIKQRNKDLIFKQNARQDVNYL